MRSTGQRSGDTGGIASVVAVDMKLEVVTIPVSDVTGPQSFTGNWDGGRTSRRRRGPVHAAGIQVGEVYHIGGDGRASGTDPAHGSYRSYATLSDPDGNGWLFQEVTTRLLGRVDAAATSFASASDPAGAMRRASAAHGEHEKRIGGADPDWPD